MKKKKYVVGVLLVIVVLLSAVAVIATISEGQALIGLFEKSDEAVSLEEISFEDQYSDAGQSFKSNIESFVSKFQTENLTYEEYSSIESYIAFVLENSPSDKELAVIHSLLNDGYTIQTLSQIYDFYLTTSEDEQIISKIASLDEEYWGDNWIENAYNDITGEKHGVLDTDDIKNYLDKGLSLEDISYANILCRKGVHTIDEILTMKQNGDSWEKINNSVYSSVNTASASKTAINQKNVLTTIEADVFEETPVEAYKLTKALSKQGKSNSADSVNDENISETLEEIEKLQSEAVISAVDEELEVLGLPKRFMNVEKTKDYENDNYEKAISAGINEKTIRRLKQRGFSMAEIADASGDYDGNPLHFLALLKSGREA